MKFTLKNIYISFLLLLLLSNSIESQVLPGAYQTNLYIDKLKNKRIALVGNQTSMVGQVHLLDTLIKCKINVVRIFGPEHGFRGVADAGEKIKTDTNPSTGIKIISLYGRHVKPTPSDLKDIDIVVFDIQDVGARFFTYLSTLHYVLEACAENGKELILLDRPNPNGACIDGPILDLKHKSFVGLDPVPVLYGMTIGEYAQMINGEAWIKGSVKCNLTVIPCANYTHKSEYNLPVKPSPNLPNMQAIKLYASLALFEGTSINVGRGTEFPFQIFGSPSLDSSNIRYTPAAIPGAMWPPHKDTLCYGIDLRSVPSTNCLNITWLKFAYTHSPQKDKFFNIFFYNLSGNKLLREQIEKNESEENIRLSWQKDLDTFKQIRSKYLIYK